MKCPDCRHELQRVDCKGVVIHECSQCKGKWFERDELQKVRDRQDDTLRWLDFDPFGKDAEQLSVASEGRICPRCSKKMASLKYMKSNVVIDKCPACKGVWLDSGELVKIIRYLEYVVDMEDVKGYVKDTFKEFIKIFTGHKGVVSEVKDFLAVLYLLQLSIVVSHPELATAAQKVYQATPFK